jgi:hypothetical protein
VLSVFSLARCILIRISATLSDMSDDLPAHPNIVYLPRGLRACLNKPGPCSWVGLRYRYRVISPGGTPGAGIDLSSSTEVPGTGTGISSSSRMEGLNKSYANTLGWCGLWLDSSRAWASAASLSHRRIWWSLKLSNFSSGLLTSCRYAAMRESQQLDSPII